MTEIRPVMEISKWRDELVGLISDLGNPAELEKLWLGKKANQVSSYEEDIANIFDTYDINSFLLHFAHQSGLSPPQLAAMRRFRDALESYVDEVNRKYKGKPDPRTVLADPKWKEIMASAKDFVSIFEGDKK